MKALLLGATGLIGKETLAQLRTDTRFEKVLVLARKDGVSDDRVTWRKTDFDGDETYARLTSDAIDVVFCCMGTTIKQAGSREAFTRVDYEYPMRVANALRASAAKVRFALVSSVGADATSSSFYLRTKGELERELGKMGFASVEIMQPSLLLGAREESRVGEVVSTVLMRPLGMLMRGPLAKYHAIEGKDVARALIASVTQPAQGAVTVHQYAKLMGMKA